MTIKENINIIISNDKLLNQNKEYEQNKINIKQKIINDVHQNFNNIILYLNYPTSISNLNIILNKDKRFILKQDKKVYFNNQFNHNKVNYDNYYKDFKTYHKILNNVSYNMTFEQIRNYFNAYNTLIFYIEHQEDVINTCIQSKLSNNKFDGNKEVIENELNKAVECLKNIEIKDIIHRQNDGTIVIGKEALLLSSEEESILNKYNIDVEKIKQSGDNIILSNQSGSVHINFELNKENANQIESLIKGLYYNNILAFNPSEFHLAVAEKRNDSIGGCTSRLIGELRNYEKQENHFDSYIYKIITKDNNNEEFNLANTWNQFVSLIEMLDSEQGERSNLLSFEDCNSLFEYNQKNPYKTRSCILLLINGLPFDDHKYNIEETLKKLENIIKNGPRLGIYTLLLGKDEEIKINNELWQLQYDKLNIKKYELDNSNINWISINEDNIPNIISCSIQNNEKYQALSIENLIDIVEKKGDLNKSKLANGEIAIPIGLSDGDPYYFATSVDEVKSSNHGGPHSFVYGITGKGKTTMIKTMIMSGAYFYSPNELQFYILDFKAKEGNPDYFEFVQDLKQDNSYVPHIKFISLRANKSFASEVIEMIDNFIDERNKIGCNDYYEYCKKQKENPDLYKPLPIIYFLIDEYNEILNSNNHKILESIESLTKRCRQVGISITLIGQELTLNAAAFPNFVNRYSFGNDSFGAFSSCFSKDSDKYDAIRKAYNQIGSRAGFVVSNRTINNNYVLNCTKVAFTRDASALAKKIKDKWNISIVQQQGGSLEEVSADWIVKSKESDENKNNPLFMPFIDENTYNLYIGLSSLEGTPTSILYGKRKVIINDEPSKYRNYFIKTSEKKQIIIEENAMFSYAEYLRNNKINDQCYISYNYCSDWKMNSNNLELAVNTSNLIINSSLSKYIKINDNKISVLNEIERAYQIYCERKELDNDEEYSPYLFSFFNCKWIPYLKDYSNISELKINLGSIKEESAKQAVIDMRNANITDENIIEYFYNDGLIDKLNLGQQSINGETISDHLQEIIKNGGKYNVWVLIGINTFEDFGWFIKPDDNYKEVIIEGEDTNQYTCKLRNKIIRLFNYHIGTEWLEKFNKEE